MAKEFFKNLPDTSTPLSASRLNGLLNGNESMGSIVVEDVKCKNLFNKSNFKIDVQGKLGFDISSLEIGKTYTFSSNLPIKSLKISDYTSGINSVAKDEENGFTTFTFTMVNTSGEEKQYLFLAITDVWSWVTNISELDSYDIQIEEGTTATEYTPYKAFGIESGSNSNGSWIKFQDGTLLMHGSKTFSVTPSDFTALGSTGFVYLGQDTITLPITSTVEVVPTVNVRSKNFDWATRVYGSTDNILYQTFSNANGERNITVTWSAIGRWK